MQRTVGPNKGIPRCIVRMHCRFFEIKDGCDANVLAYECLQPAFARAAGKHLLEKRALSRPSVDVKLLAEQIIALQTKAVQKLTIKFRFQTLHA